MKKIYYLIGIIIISFFMITSVFLFLLSPISNSKEKVLFEVKNGQTYSTLGSQLAKQKLIRSEFAYKLYIKMTNPKILEACTHQLSADLNVAELIKELSLSCNSNNEALKITIPEGKNLEQVAEIVSKSINKTKKELFTVWTSSEFVNKAIEKYDFLTDEIKNKKIRYSLEGYLFPSTYEIANKDVDAEYIAYKMLDQMDVIYKKYQKDIEKSKYTFHQIMTMASLVEYEAILDEDRALIAGVFYNRLDAKDRFGSCATLGYAINDWKITYTYKDMQVDSPYNTYKYPGFPPGPGGMPGEKSIEAAVKPTETKYYYFMANVCDVNDNKTYFSVTSAEHDRKSKEMLGCLR